MFSCPELEIGYISARQAEVAVVDALEGSWAEAAHPIFLQRVRTGYRQVDQTQSLLVFLVGVGESEGNDEEYEQKLQNVHICLLIIETILLLPVIAIILAGNTVFDE